MEQTLKDCPSCKRQIQQDASFCPYCGARFVVRMLGYCTNCHQVKEVDQHNRCLTCGETLIDLHAESQYAAESQRGVVVVSPTESPPPPPAARSAQAGLDQEIKAPTAPKNDARRGCRSCAWIAAVVLLLLAAPLLLFPDLLDRLPMPGFLASPTPAGESALPGGADVSATATAVSATRTPAPTATQTVKLPALASNAACFNNESSGVTCLDDRGWTALDRDSLPGVETMQDLTRCADGRVLWLSNRAVFEYTETGWVNRGRGEASYPRLATCGPEGELWVVDMEAAHHYDGSAWSALPFEGLYAGATSATVMEIAADAQGTLWIATHEKILRHDSAGWTIFAKDSGLNKDYLIRGLALDSQGRPWVAHAHGILIYDGEKWRDLPIPAAYNVKTILIDSADRVWAGTQRGVSLYEKDHWVNHYEIGKQAGGVLSLAIDEQQRVWAGTLWGAAVLEKGQWTAYQMQNSGLIANHIDSLLVMGPGPRLPEYVEKAPGGLSGKLLNGGAALVNARVEVCVEEIGILYQGATPCTDQPFVQSAKTSADGHYSFKNLPPGFYTVIFQTPDGKWKVLSRGLHVGSVQVLVRSGETTTVEDLDISE